VAIPTPKCGIRISLDEERHASPLTTISYTHPIDEELYAIIRDLPHSSEYGTRDPCAFCSALGVTSELTRRRE
jgi:hypothetical protein